MRSPTLLTGLTGAVAVLVLFYVGLTAMNLQPHITFGNPDLRMASVATVPPKPTAPTIAAAKPTAPAAPTTPVAAPLPAAALPAASQPPAGPGPQPDAAANPANAGSSPAVTTAPAAAPSAAPVPTTAAAIPQTPPSSTETPAAVTPAGPAAPSPDLKPPPSVAALPAPTAPPPLAAFSTPANPSTEAPAAAEMPAVASTLPAAAEPKTVPAPVVAAAEASTSPAADRSFTERMAPTPPTPTPPRVSSVPTPLARPTPPAAEQGDTPVAVATLPSDDKAAQVDKPVQPPAGNAAAATESAALAPQPEKPADDATIVQPNGDLKPIDLSRPFAERAGILTIGGRSLQLAGIVPTDPERSCTGPNGKEWPCGTLARTALRSFLLGRTITCDVADPAWKGEITAECRFAKLSLGDWLARNGWAEVASGSPFAGAADEARKAGRGVYGNDPRKKHQSTLAPEPPKEDPLNPI
jgi:endonuclease YncB( thermonuclease family)